MAPGLLLQSLTTREPDNEMVEVAIAALRRTMRDDGVPESPAAVGAGAGD